MIGWEIILIYIIVAAAFGYMIWFLFIPRRKKSRCSGCPHSGSCEKNKKANRL